MTAVIGAFLLVGLFFHAVAALGVIRLPDFYTRLHAVSKAETLGVVLTVFALVLAVGPSLLGVKLVLVAVFLFLANPTSTHAIARRHSGPGPDPGSARPRDRLLAVKPRGDFWPGGPGPPGAPRG